MREIACGQCGKAFERPEPLIEHLLETGHCGFSEIATDNPGAIQEITTHLTRIQLADHPDDIEGVSPADPEEAAHDLMGLVNLWQERANKARAIAVKAGEALSMSLVVMKDLQRVLSRSKTAHPDILEALDILREAGIE